MNDPSRKIVDEILVMDCQSGNVKALELLVSRWQKRLWTYAYRILGDSEAAWDITQESWLGIVRGIRKLEDPARFGPWCFRIVGNKANDWIRKRQADRQPAQQTEPAQACGDCERLDKASDLSAILRKLPRNHREILMLYYIEQLNVGEIAIVLDVPNGTVKSRLHKAREQFRKLWQASEHE